MKKKHIDKCQICGEFDRVNAEGRCDFCQEKLEDSGVSVRYRPPHIPPDDDIEDEPTFGDWDVEDVF